MPTDFIMLHGLPVSASFYPEWKLFGLFRLLYAVLMCERELALALALAYAKPTHTTKIKSN